MVDWILASDPLPILFFGKKTLKFGFSIVRLKIKSELSDSKPRLQPPPSKKAEQNFSASEFLFFFSEKLKFLLLNFINILAIRTKAPDLASSKIPFKV